GGGTGRGGGVRGGAVGVRGGAGGGWVHLPAGEIRPGGLRGPAATQRSSNSTTQFIRSGYFNSGSSNRKFGHCARGGKLSRAKVSRCAVMAVAPRQNPSYATLPALLPMSRHSAASADFPERFFNSSRAITTFCTSVAPS